MTIELFQICSTLVYFLGLVFVQRKLPFLPVIPIQIVCSPYFVTHTLVDGWEHSGLEIAILFASVLLIMPFSLPRLFPLCLNRNIVLFLIITIAPLLYGTLLAALYGNNLYYVLLELIPAIEFILFFCWMTLYIGKLPININYIHNLGINLLYMASVSAVTTYLFGILYPESILFDFSFGGNISVRLTDFIAPMAAIVSFSYFLGRKFRDDKLMVKVVIIIATLISLVVSLLGLYRTLWMAVSVTLFLMLLVNRRWWTVIFIALVAVVGIYKLNDFSVLAARFNQTSIFQNPRIQQLLQVEGRIADRPWGSGVGATIRFADKTDATKEGPGAFVVEERPYNGNFYASWIYYAGPLILPFYAIALIILFRGYIVYARKERQYIIFVALYLCLLLTSFPAILHYPILALLGMLFAAILTNRRGHDFVIDYCRQL